MQFISNLSPSNSAALQFSGRYEIAESVSKGVHYNKVDAAFKPYKQEIDTMLPQSMVIMAETAQEITPREQPASVDEVLITGLKNADGVELSPVKVRKHLPEPFDLFAQRVMRTAKALASIEPDLFVYFNTCVDLKKNSFQRWGLRLLNMTEEGLKAQGVTFNYLLEDFAKPHEPSNINETIEATITRELFKGFNETVQLRKLPDEDEKAFLERVIKEKDRPGLL